MINNSRSPFFKITLFLYRLVMHLPIWATKFIAGKSKFSRSIQGRKNWESEWRSRIDPLRQTGGNKLVWMHAASLGEFEQGSPVLRALRKAYPEMKIVATFFSPSGYEIRKNTPLADATGYLPWDNPGNARQILDLLRPDLIIWVKYDYWFYFLREINQRQIPLLLISAIFRKEQPFFQWYGEFHRQMLEYFTRIFVQNERSREKISSFIGANNIEIAGDTRFDTVLEMLKESVTLPYLQLPDRLNQPVLIAGSTWPGDEILLKEFIEIMPEFKMIIAPHEIDEKHLLGIEKLFSGKRYSQINSCADAGSRVIIIDSIGKLKYLYPYGHYAYIGGGFNKSGIHNTLEAAAYGKPVLFGPNYQKFAEAVSLIKNGAAFSVKNGEELAEKIRSLSLGSNAYSNAAMRAEQFVKENAGATEAIMQYIRENVFD